MWPITSNRPVVARNENWDLIFMMKNYLSAFKWYLIHEIPTKDKDFTKLCWSNFFFFFLIFSPLLSLLFCKWALPTTGLFQCDGSHVFPTMCSDVSMYVHEWSQIVMSFLGAGISICTVVRFKFQYVCIHKGIHLCITAQWSMEGIISVL